jgi:hypothetical protein
MNAATLIQSAPIARPLYSAGTLRPATKYCDASTVRQASPMLA